MSLCLPFLECLQTNGSGCAVTLGFCVSLCLSADNAARAPGGDRRHVPGQRLCVLAALPPDRNQPGLLVRRRLNARPRLDRWLSFRARSLTRACPRSGGICVLKYCGGCPIPFVCQFMVPCAGKCYCDCVRPPISLRTSFLF